MALSGSVLVFSGTLSTPTAEAKKQAEAAGAKLRAGSVSGKTMHLVAGQKTAAATARGQSLVYTGL